MKKRIIPFILAIAMVFSFTMAGCSAAEEVVEDSLDYFLER